MAEAAVDFEAFWSFSLDRYGRDGVAALCLALQDAHGADVNILLACLFAAEHGVPLGASDIENIAAGQGGQWHCAVVAPLRAARRAMQVPLKGLDADQVEAARKQLKAVELEAERLEQMLLFAGLKTTLNADAALAVGDLEARRTMARSALAAYLDVLGARAEAMADLLVDVCIG